MALSRSSRFVLASACLATALSTLGCDSEPTAEGTVLEARVALGTVDGTDIALGALLDGDSLTLYQCGGDDTFATHTRWFRGTIGAGEDPDGFELERDDFQLVGTRDAEGLSGELIEADGSRHAFRVDGVDDDDEAGVYVVQEGDVNVGVVVQESGGELVAQGAGCDDVRACAQVIILAPLTIGSSGIGVQVEVAGALVDTQVVRTLEPPAGV